MRIGVDVRMLYHRTAGIGSYTIQLLTALSKIDRENDYVLLQHRRQTKPLINAPRFSRATAFTPAHYRFEQWPLSIETRRFRLDLLHSPDFIPPLHNKIPSVITVHDLAFLLYPKFVTASSARYYGQVEDAVKRANRIIAVSHSTKNDIIELLGTPEGKIDVIYEAAAPFYRPISRQQAQGMLQSAGIQFSDRFILSVGTIEPRKNLMTLIHAYKILRDRYKHDLPLALAGAPGWLSEEMREDVKKLGLVKDVHFLGKTADKHLLALYNLATVFAHPAHYEGFGLPPLEAMACATPVVCSDAGSLPEVAGDAAILVPPKDVEAWAAALHRIIDDDDLQADLSQKGVERARTFSWQKSARETLETYRKAVAG
jgi:glycosyltransferase involved in cell wall biosynthesis